MIEKLKSLLQPDSQFEEIAKMLFQNFHIEKGEHRYDFLEIEYYSSLIDEGSKITYKRTCEAGDWFPHYSGVDIAFKSDENQYGGILIRSLLQEKREIIAGPLRCSCELLEGLADIYGNSKPLRLVENTKQKEKIEWTIREGIPSDITNMDKKKYYCAYVQKRYNCDPDWKNGMLSYHAKPWKRINNKK